MLGKEMLMSQNLAPTAKLTLWCINDGDQDINLVAKTPSGEILEEITLCGMGADWLLYNRELRVGDVFIVEPMGFYHSTSGVVNIAPNQFRITESDASMTIQYG